MFHRAFVANTVVFLLSMVAALPAFGGPPPTSITVSLTTGKLSFRMPPDLMPAPPPLFRAMKSHEPPNVRLLAFLVGRDADHPRKIDPCHCRTVYISTMRKAGKYENPPDFAAIKVFLKRRIKMRTIAAQESAIGTKALKSMFSAGAVSLGAPVVFLDKPNVFAWYSLAKLTEPTGKKVIEVAGNVVLSTEGSILFIYPHYTLASNDPKEMAHAVSWMGKETDTLVKSITK